MNDRGDPGRIDLSHVTFGMGRIEKALIVMVVLVGITAGVWVWSAPRIRATCPDGYALAGGGFAGALHCVPGAPVQYLPDTR